MPRGGVLTPDQAGDWCIEIAGYPVLRLTTTDRRVGVHLVMPGIERSVDVSVSPATALRALREAAQRTGTPPSRTEAELRHALDRLTTPNGTHDASDDRPLLASLGGSCFPMLAEAYAAGAAPIEEVPRWASHILAAPDARTAARRAFGTSATRPVTAAFARSLVRGDASPVDLSRLGLALIGSDVLEPDRIARVLTAPGTAPTGTEALTPTRIDDARTATRRWGADRTFGYLCQAASDTAHRQLFADCLTWAIDLGAHAPIRVPRELADLEDLYRQQVRSPATEPTPPRARACTEAVARTEAPTPQHADQDRATHRPGGTAPDYGLHFAPRVPGPPRFTNATTIGHPRWLRAVDGTATATFSFVLPRTCGDLARWSRLLGNCLDTYRAAAVAGASHLVGIETNGLLRYVIEIDPDRRIRQFTGQANRRPSRANHDEIVDHLRALQVLV